MQAAVRVPAAVGSFVIHNDAYSGGQNKLSKLA